VAKLRTFARSSRLNDFNALHHHTMLGSDPVYPLYSVAARHSSTSMSGVPEINSSNSCSLNCETKSADFVTEVKGIAYNGDQVFGYDLVETTQKILDLVLD